MLMDRSTDGASSSPAGGGASFGSGSPSGDSPVPSTSSSGIVPRAPTSVSDAHLSVRSPLYPTARTRSRLLGWFSLLDPVSSDALSARQTSLRVFRFHTLVELEDETMR